MRRCCRSGALPELLQWATVGSSPRDRDERIDHRDVGPRRGQRGKRTGVVLIEHAVLTPGLPDRQQLERPPRQRVEGVGDAKDSMRSPLITSSRQLSPKVRLKPASATRRRRR